MSWLRPHNRAYEKVEGRDMSQRLLKGKLERFVCQERENGVTQQILTKQVRASRAQDLGLLVLWPLTSASGG